jgi:XRE family transcriptional regulator, regulator of sulfur utilization
MKTPRLPLLLGLVLAAALAARAQAPAAAKPVLTAMKDSAVFDAKDFVAKEWPNGSLRRMVFDGPSAKMDELECHVTTLKAGQTSGAPHTHTDEELTVVNAGTVEVLINGHTQAVGPGSVFYFAPQDTVGIRNPGPRNATYTVFKMTVHAVPVATK